MSLAYRRGFTAGLRARFGKKYARPCPYEGHNDGSLALQQQWMDGYFDAVTGRRSLRKNLRPRRPVCARVRWPRSQYARNRVQAALAGKA